MGHIKIQADRYFNDKKKLDMIFGDMVCPVDLNGGYVAEKKDKFGMDEECGEYTEENIQERFDLKTPNKDQEDQDY